MPFDSEGNFTRIHSWEDDRINDIDIVTDHHDEEDNNLAEGLSQTFLRDGRVAMRGNIDAAEYKQVVLGLIFLKYISDTCIGSTLTADERTSEIIPSALSERVPTITPRSSMRLPSSQEVSGTNAQL